MIIGVDNDKLEATIPIDVRGPHGEIVAVTGVIDSGFEGMLSLPSATIARLDLVWQSTLQYRLGDGSLRSFEIYAAEIHWDGSWRRIVTLESDASPLLGMILLKGNELRMEVRPGGRVSITPLGDEGDAAGETLVI